MNACLDQRGAAKPDSEQWNAPNQPATSPDGLVSEPRRSVLLVDDASDVLEVLTFFLQRAGFNVLPCLSAREAMNGWHSLSRQVDLLIADLGLGNGPSGLELAQQLHAEAPTLPIIYISGARIELEDPNVFVEGVNYLPKPFNPLTLAQMARSVLERWLTNSTNLNSTRSGNAG